MKRNIILIGFMGVGKGTVARHAALKSGMYALDTDDLIESLENRRIKKIFESEGEPYFRALEARTAQWLSGSVENTIISTGGGFFKVEGLKSIGTVVLLDSSFDGILNRILQAPNAKKKLKKRPLFQDPKKAKALYKERLKGYKAVADHVISVENRPLDAIYDDLKKIIKGLNKAL